MRERRALTTTSNHKIKMGMAATFDPGTDQNHQQNSVHVQILTANMCQPPCILRLSKVRRPGVEAIAYHALQRTEGEATAYQALQKSEGEVTAYQALQRSEGKATAYQALQRSEGKATAYQAL